MNTLQSYGGKMRCNEDAHLFAGAYVCQKHRSYFRSKNRFFIQLPIHTAPYHQSQVCPVCIMTFQDPITSRHTDGQRWSDGIICLMGYSFTDYAFILGLLRNSTGAFALLSFCFISQGFKKIYCCHNQKCDSVVKTLGYLSEGWGSAVGHLIEAINPMLCIVLYYDPDFLKARILSVL